MTSLCRITNYVVKTLCELKCFEKTTKMEFVVDFSLHG